MIREINHPDRVEMVLEIPEGNEVTMVREEPTIKQETDDKIGNRTLQAVLQYIKEHPHCKSMEIARYIGLQITQTKSYIYRLLDDGLIKAYGANRNRTYSVNVSD